MIYDRLDNLERYNTIIPYMKEIIKFLNENKMHGLEVGTHTLIENRLKVKIQEITTQPKEERPWESHKEWIDIQLPITGAEGIGAIYTDVFPSVKEAHPERDTWYYEECDHSYGVLDVYPGEFVVFMPGELHKPRCMVQQPKAIRKMIIKVRIK